MPTNRDNIKTGPAALTWDGAVLYFKDGISIDVETLTFDDVKADVHTLADPRVADRRINLTGTPVGAWKDLSKLFKWVGSAVGTRLHGATDKAAVVHFLDGERFTFHNAALSKMPGLFFSPTKTLLGGVEFRCRTKKNTLASAANSLFTFDTAAFTDTSFDLAEILTQAYTLNHGASPWDAFDTTEGVEMTPETTWREIISDSHGVLDEELTDCSFTSAFTPLGISVADIMAKMALQGVAAANRGGRLAAVGNDFTLSATDVHVIQRNAMMRKAQFRSGSNINRAGAVELVSGLSISGGAQVAALYVGTEAPEEE